MSESPRNNYAPIAISLLIAAISWLLTTTWSEYSSRQIITYKQSHKGDLTTFRIRNESFLNNSPELNLIFTCPASPTCLQKRNFNYIGATAYSPLAPATISEGPGNARAASIKLAAMLPRSMIDLTLKPATDENAQRREILIYFQPDTSSDRPVLIIAAGPLTWMLGNFLWILLALGTVSCALLLAILLPSIRDSYSRPIKPDASDAASEKSDE